MLYPMTEAKLNELLEQAGRVVDALGESGDLMRLEMLGGCESRTACAVFPDQAVITAGDASPCFTLMSAIKPFLLLHLLEVWGAGQVAEWVDDRPSNQPYYSLRQLREDGGRPRNAMINSGAMLLASKLAGGSPFEQQEVFVAWLRKFCPQVNLRLHEECFAEVMEPDSDVTSRTIARALSQAGHVRDDDDAYEIYFRLCCLAGNIVDMAKLGQALACSGSEHREQVLYTMSHSGLYEGTPDWFSRTRLPAKSGVSGVMFALYPGGSCIAACDPWLDEGGNPVLPQLLLAAA